MVTQAGLTSLLIKSGATQLATAFVWGTQVPNTPYPRIALSAHMNMIQEGLLAVAAGLIARDPSLINLSDWQLNLIVAAHLGLWAVDISGMCNSFWGTNKTLKMLAKESDAKGAKDWQETIVGFIAIAIPLPLIPAWALIAYKLFW